VSASSHKLAGSRGVILDLDDTLYPEHDYFLSGIRAVAEFASRRLLLPVDDLQRELDSLAAAPEGRSRLFDRFLRRLDRWSGGFEATLVHVYRTHKPRLQPCPDVIPALHNFKQAGRLIALVTDGPATVQRAKFEALGVGKFFHALVFTDDLPLGCRKPSAVPFVVAAELLGVRPQDCVAFADDPAKDFLGPRELGMHTVRIRRPLRHPLQAQTTFPPSHEADEVYESLESAAGTQAPRESDEPPVG
jgi:putative hydrolase of the HAD superfamily